MVNDIYDPLTEYIKVYCDRFKGVAEATFAELAKEAQVDTEANQETCRKIYATEKVLASVKTYIKRWQTARVLLWLGLIGGIVAVWIYYEELSPLSVFFIALLLFFVLLFIFLKINPRLTKLKSEGNDLAETVKPPHQQARGRRSRQKHHGLILAALGLMYGDGVGHVQLVEHRELCKF